MLTGFPAPAIALEGDHRQHELTRLSSGHHSIDAQKAKGTGWAVGGVTAHRHSTGDTDHEPRGTSTLTREGSPLGSQLWEGKGRWHLGCERSSWGSSCRGNRTHFPFPIAIGMCHLRTPCLQLLTFPWLFPAHLQLLLSKSPH